MTKSWLAGRYSFNICSSTLYIACEWKTSRASASRVTMNGKNARKPYAATANANVCTSALVRNFAPGIACRLKRLNLPVAGVVAMLLSKYAASHRKPEVADSVSAVSSEVIPSEFAAANESRDLRFKTDPTPQRPH